jgi:hypothetical protein
MVSVDLAFAKAVPTYLLAQAPRPSPSEDAQALYRVRDAVETDFAELAKLGTVG